jgi:cob(I)alamin adenosyltransferase
MKIYTKAGDRGMTSLLGGEFVAKDHPRLEAYGTLDELNAWIGLLTDLVEENSGRSENVTGIYTDEEAAALRAKLLRIQDRIMTASSILANEKTDGSVTLPQLREEDITCLEEGIDQMDMELPGLTSFILPGGHPVISYCHLARTTCRRAERHSTRFVKDSEQHALLVKYLNRLSDYLFTLARKFSRDFDIKEIPWQPEL